MSPTDVKEDEVDLILAKTDGRLERKRDPKLCRHNSNGCCVHCSPLEPWNEEYLKEQKIKHLSFHSYIRKLTSGVDRGKFVALEDLVMGKKHFFTLKIFSTKFSFLNCTGLQH